MIRDANYDIPRNDVSDYDASSQRSHVHELRKGKTGDLASFFNKQGTDPEQRIGSIQGGN